MNSRTHGMFWVSLQIILLIAWVVLLLAGERYIPDDTPRAVMDAGGLALMLAGLLLAALGAFGLQGNLTPLPAPKPDAELVSKGIFGRVRHPIYGGIILMVIGATLFFPTLLGALFVPVVIAFFYMKSVHEERQLAERFPAYQDYTGSTRRFFPGLW